MRVWPSSDESATLVVPASTPIVMTQFSTGMCSGASANTSGFFAGTCCQGTTPTSTIAVAQ